MAPSFPPHDGGDAVVLPHRLVATWPEGTFVENIDVDPDGTMYCTAKHPKELYRVRGERVDVFTTLPEEPNGIAIDRDGVIWLNSGGGFDATGPNSIWRLDADGTAQKWVTIQEATFLNGMTVHPDGRL